MPDPPRCGLQAFLACGEHATRVLVTNPGPLHWRSHAGLAALRSGDRDLAQRLIADEQELAEALGAPRAIGVAMRAAAMLERADAALGLSRWAAEILAGTRRRRPGRDDRAELILGSIPGAPLVDGVAATAQTAIASRTPSLRLARTWSATTP